MNNNTTGKRERVIKAIRFDGPDRVPVYLFNRDLDESDIVSFDIQHHFQGSGRDLSEWGFRWSRLDDTMGQPLSTLLDSWTNLSSLSSPDPGREDRLAGLDEFVAGYPDHFRLASLALSGFTTMSFLRGFDNLMLDLLLEPDRVRQLADLVFGFENELIERLPQGAFHAVAFFDDWGTQTGPIIAPELWRDIFKPYYARQFELVHAKDLFVYYHTCGQISPIVADLIEVGVDILNIAQPNLYDIPQLGRDYGGQVCFECPVSYQTTSITGSPADIYRDVEEIVTSLGRFNGGLIGYVEEYESIGMPEENYQACVNAFREVGHRVLS